MNTKPNFAERIDGLKRVAKRLHELANMSFDYEGSMQDVAEDLRAAADVVMTEAQHMDASARRFAERKNRYPQRPMTRASR